MHRSLQLQVLSWLAALATLGAALRPSFDTLLFAVAIVFGTMLLHAKERLGEPRSTPRAAFVGRVVGAALAWGVVALRALSALGSKFPSKLTPAVLVAAAVVPTGVVIIESLVALRTRRVRPRESED